MQNRSETVTLFQDLPTVQFLNTCTRTGSMPRKNRKKSGPFNIQIVSIDRGYPWIKVWIKVRMEATRQNAELKDWVQD